MSRKPGNKIKDYLELAKIKIMVPVSLTGFTGYFIFNSHITLKIFIITLGILIMAISASVLNQLQEVELDSKMTRTQDRPLPSGKITPEQAIIFFFLTLLSGTALIYFSGNLTAALIGLFTVFWYNGIYTYAKRITAFAVVPGAVTGALPPLIGWVAAGGEVWDKSIIFVEFMFFIGQVPHFWLLIMKYGEEYEKAGIPSLTGILSRSQINRLTFTWVVTSVIAALFLCHFGIIRSGVITVILIIASAIIIWQFSELFKRPEEKKSFRKYSILLDSYFFLMLLLLISDRILT
jgi:protoheme IX farnesyltransferase